MEKTVQNQNQELESLRKTKQNQEKELLKAIDNLQKSELRFIDITYKSKVLENEKHVNNK